MNATTISIGPEQAVPMSYKVAAPPQRFDYSIGQAQIASDGQSFVVVWASIAAKGKGAIIVTVLDGEGTLQKTRSLPYTEDANVISVAWTGISYRILWRDLDGRVAAADIDRDGNIVHPRIEITPSGVTGIAAKTDRSLILYSTAGFEYGAKLVRDDGTIIRPEFPLTGAGTFPTATADDRGFSIFWVEPSTSTLYTTHLTSDGIQNSAQIPIASLHRVESFVAASNGSENAVAVIDVTQPTAYSIRRFTLKGSSQVTELPPIPAPPPESLLGLRLIADGAGFLANWMSGNTASYNLHTVHFSATDPGIVEGRVFDEGASFASGSQLLGIGTGYQGGFILDRNPPGSLVKTFPITQYLVPQNARGVATIGDQSVAVWTEENTVLASRIDHSGAAIDVHPLIVGYVAPSNFPLATVNVVATASHYWITWWTGFGGIRKVMLRSISTAGEMSEPLDTPFQDSQASAGASASTVLVVDQSRGIARFGEAGNLLDVTPFSSGSLVSPRVAYNGEHFLIVWQPTINDCFTRFCFFPYTHSYIFAQRIDASGKAIDKRAITVTPSEPYNALLVGAVASDGHDFMVTFTQQCVAKAKPVSRDGLAGTSNNLIPNKRIAALAPAFGGYVAFATDNSKTDVIRTDSDGVATETIGAFDGVVVGASRRNDGTVLVVYTRPSEIREAAGASQVFTRIVSPTPSRFHAVTH